MHRLELGVYDVFDMVAIRQCLQVFNLIFGSIELAMQSGFITSERAPNSNILLPSDVKVLRMV
jgi:hypothetical protein